MLKIPLYLKGDYFQESAKTRSSRLRSYMLHVSDVVNVHTKQVQGVLDRKGELVVRGP